MRIFHKNRPEPTSTPTPAAGQDAPARDAAAPSRQPSPLSADSSISARTSPESTQRPRGNFGNMMDRLHLGSGRGAHAPTVSNPPNLPPETGRLPNAETANSVVRTAVALHEIRITGQTTGVSTSAGMMGRRLGLAEQRLEAYLGQPAIGTGKAQPNAALEIASSPTPGDPSALVGKPKEAVAQAQMHRSAEKRFDKRLGQPAVGTGKAQPDAALDFASKLPKDLGDKYLNATERLNEAVSSAEKQYGTDHAAFPPGIKESISGIRDQQNAVVDQAMTRMLFPK
jgi:hypothetical protein